MQSKSKMQSKHNTPRAASLRGGCVAPDEAIPIREVDKVSLICEADKVSLPEVNGLLPYRDCFVERCSPRNDRVILGIDPGYAIMGGGVIETNGTDFIHVNHGVIETHASEEMGQRLALIHRELSAVIKKYQPAEIAIEEVFFGKNAKTAIKVSHARGVILLCAVEHTGRVYEYKPANIKLAVAGVGNAKKPQVQARVQEILRLAELPKQDDAADALAIALTCAILSARNEEQNGG